MRILRILLLCYSFLFFWGFLRERVAPFAAPILALCAAGLCAYLLAWRVGRRFVGVFLAVLHLNYSVAGWAIVDGASMEPSFHAGEILLVEKWKYGWIVPPVLPAWRSSGYMRIAAHLPERNDCITIRYPGLNSGPDAFLVKRVGAVAGDEYEFRAEGFFVNGKLIGADVRAQPNTVQPPAYEVPEFFSDDFAVYSASNGVPPRGKVPPGFVLVLGDNSANSRDSRSFGFVPVEFVTGRVP